MPSDIHPCTPDLTPLCDPNAPLYTNGEGNTIPVFYEHDFYAANGTDLTPIR